MKIKFKKTYISPTSEAVEVRTSGMLCQSIDGLSLDKGGYGQGTTTTWNGEDY